MCSTSYEDRKTSLSANVARQSTEQSWPFASLFSHAKKRARRGVAAVSIAANV